MKLIVSYIILYNILHIPLFVDVNSDCNMQHLTHNNSLSPTAFVFQDNQILSELHINWKHQAGVACVCVCVSGSSRDVVDAVV